MLDCTKISDKEFINLIRSGKSFQIKKETPFLIKLYLKFIMRLWGYKGKKKSPIVIITTHGITLMESKLKYILYYIPIKIAYRLVDHIFCFPHEKKFLIKHKMHPK